jgi:hypothetical protein
VPPWGVTEAGRAAGPAERGRAAGPAERGRAAGPAAPSPAMFFTTGGSTVDA